MDSKHPGKAIIERYDLRCVSKRHFTADNGDRFTLRVVSIDNEAHASIRDAQDALRSAGFISRNDDSGALVMIGPSYEVVKFVRNDAARSRSRVGARSEQGEEYRPVVITPRPVAENGVRGGEMSAMALESMSSGRMDIGEEEKRDYDGEIHEIYTNESVDESPRILSTVLTRISGRAGADEQRSQQEETTSQRLRRRMNVVSGCKCPPQPPPDNGVTCVSAGMIQREREASEKAASEAAAKEEPPKEAKKKGKGVKGGEKKQAAAAPVQQKPKAAAKRIKKPSPVKVNVKSQAKPQIKTEESQTDTGLDTDNDDYDFDSCDPKRPPNYCPRPQKSLLKGRDFAARSQFVDCAEAWEAAPYCAPAYKEPRECYSKRASKGLLCPEELEEEEEPQPARRPTLAEEYENKQKEHPEICRVIKAEATADGVANISMKALEGEERNQDRTQAGVGNPKDYNIGFLMRYFPKFCEEHHFASMLLSIKPMTTARYNGMIKALDLREKLDYFSKTEAQRRIGYEDFEEKLMDPKRHLDYVQFVTDHDIKDWQKLKMPSTENRLVMREGDLVVDTRNTKDHFYVDVFSRGAGDKYVRNGVVINKEKQRVDIGSNVYRMCPFPLDPNTIPCE